MVRRIVRDMNLSGHAVKWAFWLLRDVISVILYMASMLSYLFQNLGNV